MTVLPVPLENLTRRLAETPDAFFALAPDSNPQGQSIRAPALFNDILWDIQEVPLTLGEIQFFKIPKGSDKETRLFQLIQMIFWLISDPSLKTVPGLKTKIFNLLKLPNPQNKDQSFLFTLAQIVGPEKFKTDPDRREELVRLVMSFLEILPRGEELSRFKDRLRTLDSIERLRVIEETRAAAKRAREIEEALARKEAEEAASKYQRE